MSSMDIVAFINSTRSKGEPELLHYSFLEKVRSEIDNAPNFRGIYKDALGREKPCFYLDEEASTLMAMSYSKVVRKTIYRAGQSVRRMA